MIKNRLIYLIIFAGCSLISIAFPGKMTIMIFTSVFFLPILSWLQFKLTSSKLKIEQSLKEERIQKCQPTILNISLLCPKFIPTLRVEYYADTFILVNGCDTTWVSVSKKRVIQYEIYSQYRGKYKIGVQKAIAYDFLGLFKYEYSCPPLRCKVFPQAVALENFTADYGQEIGTRAKDLLSLVDRTMVSDIRQYNPQDNMKDINWKVSAKHGELLVKNYEVLQNEGVTIIIDLHENGYDLQQNLELEDRMISASLAMINLLVKAAMPVQLLYADQSKIKQCGRESSIEELLDTTAFLPFEATITIMDILHTVEQSSTGGTVFLITHNLDEALCRHMVQQKAYSSKLILFYFEAERDNAIEKKQTLFTDLRQKGIMCHQIKQQPMEGRLVFSN